MLKKKFLFTKLIIKLITQETTSYLLYDKVFSLKTTPEVIIKSELP
jgi:hypothetical protein